MSASAMVILNIRAKINFCSKFAVNIFRDNVANADFGSQKVSPYIIL